MTETIDINQYFFQLLLISCDSNRILSSPSNTFGRSQKAFWDHRNIETDTEIDAEPKRFFIHVDQRK